MRLSINSGDCGHQAFRRLPRSVKPTVLLNGREVAGVLTADDRLGYVLAYCRDASGNWKPNARGDAVMREQLHGRVEIRLVRRGH